ncbi:hypothetical protein J3F84DRAFT_386760 [Trichoderma pleuroticola]
MMCMKCNNVAFVPLFTLFLILGCKARCCWLKVMSDPAHDENLCRRLILLALTKYVSFFRLVSSATAHFTPVVRIPHQAVSCVADKLWPSPLQVCLVQGKASVFSDSMHHPGVSARRYARYECPGCCLFSPSQWQMQGDHGA